jgi:hypothetical protein
MDGVAARGQGAGEAGYLPFNAAAARRTPVGDEADRERRNDGYLRN